MPAPPAASDEDDEADASLGYESEGISEVQKAFLAFLETQRQNKANPMELQREVAQLT